MRKKQLERDVEGNVRDSRGLRLKKALTTAQLQKVEFWYKIAGKT